MLASLLSAVLIGLTGRAIRVEVDVAPGLPGTTIVGLADTALLESRERVRGAIRNTGLAYPPRRITVNLAPADLRKGGSSLDLAIAVGILVASEQLRTGGGAALVGELALGGEIRRPPGLLPLVAALARRGTGRVIVPEDGLAEAALASGIEVLPAATLDDALGLLRRGARRRAAPAVPARVDLATEPAGSRTPQRPAPPAVADDGSDHPDLAEVRGQLEGRRALEVALAGGHGLLLVGPPGSGKTLLARTIPGLLPPLDDDEALEATIVRSVATGGVDALVRRRPFRAPHHTSSYAAVVGGGPGLSPGEVTLANGGVLFLDELPEFGRDVLEALREPLEEGRVTISRVGRADTFPARFQLVAAMNPCPCGAAGEEERCRCRPGVAERYAARISGPLRDRIDVWVRMPRVPTASLLRGEPEPSVTVAARIAAAREIQIARGGRLNARVDGRHLRAVARLDPSSERRLVELADRMGLSARGTTRLLRVARTIADLARERAVTAPHLEEAARYRVPILDPGAAGA
ncbi:MAG: hypothetical protein RL338_810 [Chloroflexota bacterium]